MVFFSVKSLIITLSTWLQNTPGEAHPSACMLLAGISLKMGCLGPFYSFSQVCGLKDNANGICQLHSLEAPKTGAAQIHGDWMFLILSYSNFIFLFSH